uniref:DNA-directed RNA polymerase n=1 Tax=Salix viminalis TaxID=40686 RepID=A0A6N2L5V4_SALVM
MGASSDYVEEVGPSSKGEVDDMDMDEDLMNIILNDWNFAVLLDTIHPSRRRVNGDVHQLGLERLQNMTYSVRMKIHVNVQVYTQTVGRSDKFKTGINKVVQQNVVHTENREITIGRIDLYMDIVFALGIRSDKEVIDLIDYASNDASIVNIFFASIHDVMTNASISHEVFLGYMVKCIMEAYTGHRKCDYRDSFRNKRFELASELLERELKVHVSHALRRMTKALQRDLYGDCDVHPIEHYLNASIVTNGVTRAFSTGAWCHPFKWMERVYGVVGNLGICGKQGSKFCTRERLEMSDTHPSHWVEVVVDELFNSGMEKLVDDTYTKLDGKHKVFLNGEWVGVAKFLFVVGKLRSIRRRRQLPYQVEIKREEQLREVRIFSDAGRILCPLIVVENLDKIKAFKGGKIQSKIGRVDSLNDDGFPFIGANMQRGDIVIGKCAESGTDHSVKLKHTERGMVQKAVLSSNDEHEKNEGSLVSKANFRPNACVAEINNLIDSGCDFEREFEW